MSPGSEYERPYTSEQEELVSSMRLERRPLMAAPDMREVVKVFRAMPDLEYPVNSAGELLEKLGGPDARVEIEGMQVDPYRMVKYMPAYYFPIADAANFAEKMAELIRRNRKQENGQAVFEAVGRQFGDVEFPIRDHDGLREALKGRQLELKGRVFAADEMIDHVPGDVFPIESSEDFQMKVTTMMVSRPLLVAD